jgi:YD repeat-containing protein
MYKGARRVVVSFAAGARHCRPLFPHRCDRERLQKLPVKAMGKPDCDQECGDPIEAGTANVFVEVVDYQTAGPNKLAFIRYYNSLLGDTTMLGQNWRSNYDRKLLFFGSVTVAERADGRNLQFALNGNSWVGDTDVELQLTQSGSDWILTDSDDTVETYTPASGSGVHLASIRMRNGYTQTLQYDQNNLLTSVTDSYGRSLQFTSTNGLLSTVATPDASLLSFGYMSMLAQVGYSTTPETNVTYLYESPIRSTLLTGILDENGTRVASCSYDSGGRAISSQRGSGADSTTVAYDDTAGTATVTNSLGQQTTFQFATLQQVPKATGFARGDGAGRSIAYDANGYKASRTDWNGNQTTYANDAHGQSTTIAEAAGAPQQRVTTITYHPSFHLPTHSVSPGLTIDFSYDATGNLLSRTETDTTTNTVPYSTNGQTRAWTYTWANSLLASVTDPRSNTTQFGWDSTGALISMTNALGQVTQVTQHTADGYPQTVVDPNGVVTNLVYDGRHRLVSRTINTSTGPLTTTYTYDPAGNLIQTILPDGSALANTYDGAHRLVATADLFGQQVHYTLDALGDQTQMNVLSSASAVARQHSANFDTLGRMLRDIGGAGQTTTYAYDSNGNPTGITDPLGG